MANTSGSYSHDASDKKLDQSANADKAKEEAAHAHGHAGHDVAKIARHDDDGKDRLFEGRIQHDDADKASDRNRLEKDVAAHHHDADDVAPISDTDTHSKKKH